MASVWGRVARFVAGLVLIAIGLYLQNTWGIVIAIAGLAPLLAGVFNFCLFAPLFGGPFSGRRLAPKA
jgi:phosphoribosylcarboxyaminoimidazole (NCAIR) mutase